MHEENGIIDTLVSQLFTWVRSHGTYIPRDFQTIGGMWTVDTWELQGVRVQLMDEGYTQKIISPTLTVTQTYGRPPQWDAGDIRALRELHAEIAKEPL